MRSVQCPWCGCRSEAHGDLSCSSCGKKTTCYECDEPVVLLKNEGLPTVACPKCNPEMEKL